MGPDRTERDRLAARDLSVRARRARGQKIIKSRRVLLNAFGVVRLTVAAEARIADALAAVDLALAVPLSAVPKGGNVAIVFRGVRRPIDRRRLKGLAETFEDADKRPAQDALDVSPETPGVYAWWPADSRAASDLGLVQDGARPLYVGMAGNLRKRLRSHLRTPRSGFWEGIQHPLYTQLALVMQRLPFYLEPKTELAAHAAAALQRWMDRSLLVSWIALENSDDAAELERRLITDLDPVFNVRGVSVPEDLGAWEAEVFGGTQIPPLAQWCFDLGQFALRYRRRIGELRTGQTLAVRVTKGRLGRPRVVEGRQGEIADHLLIPGTWFEPLSERAIGAAPRSIYSVDAQEANGPAPPWSAAVREASPELLRALILLHRLPEPPTG
ncbi:MAG: hypothetical protein HYX33_00140 [Actinobacteria bacterium]|nr:hypothetical protein [Actinomycetota bacterium]